MWLANTMITVTAYTEKIDKNSDTASALTTSKGFNCILINCFACESHGCKCLCECFPSCPMSRNKRCIQIKLNAHESITVTDDAVSVDAYKWLRPCPRFRAALLLSGNRRPATKNKSGQTRMRRRAKLYVHGLGNWMHTVRAIRIDVIRFELNTASPVDTTNTISDCVQFVGD